MPAGRSEPRAVTLVGYLVQYMETLCPPVKYPIKIPGIRDAVCAYALHILSLNPQLDTCQEAKVFAIYCTSEVLNTRNTRVGEKKPFCPV